MGASSATRSMKGGCSVARVALVLLVAVCAVRNDVHAARQPARVAGGRRLHGPATDKAETRAIIRANSTAQPPSKLLGASSLRAANKAGVTMIGGFAIPHIKQQVRVGYGTS